MKLYLRLALRNLGRRRGRTGLTVAAMAGGTALLIVAVGMLYGMVWDLVAAATENYHGHAVVTAERYLERRTMQLTLPEAEPPLALFADPMVVGHSARVRGFALLSAGEAREAQTQPAELLGIDPAGEGAVSRLPRRVKQGRFLRGMGDGEIVLGRGLARRLGVAPGAEVAAVGQAADGSVAAELFTLVGILDSGDAARDSSLALVGRSDLQRMLALNDRVHEWVLALKEPIESREWAAGIRLDGMELSTWRRFLAPISEMLDMMGAYRAIYAVIFYFGVLLVTMNTMYMALLERVREFAVMGAVGLAPLRLAALLVLEALLLSALAGVLGGALGSAASWYLSVHPLDFRQSFGAMTWVGATLEPVFRCETTWDAVLWPVAMTTLLGLLVALFPAWKLYRLRPVEALREV